MVRSMFREVLEDALVEEDPNGVTPPRPRPKPQGEGASQAQRRGGDRRQGLGEEAGGEDSKVAGGV